MKVKKIVQIEQFRCDESKIFVLKNKNCSYFLINFLKTFLISTTITKY